MDNKHYISKLSTAVDLPAKEVQQLVGEVAAIFAELLEAGETIAIPSFGTFATNKNDEYIKVDEATGRRTLYPPSVGCIFEESNILRKHLSYNGTQH